MVTRTYQKFIAAFLVLMGMIQTMLFFLQDGSTLSPIIALSGVAIAIAGVVFWFEISNSDYS